MGYTQEIHQNLPVLELSLRINLLCTSLCSAQCEVMWLKHIYFFAKFCPIFLETLEKKALFDTNSYKKFSAENGTKNACISTKPLQILHLSTCENVIRILQEIFDFVTNLKYLGFLYKFCKKCIIGNHFGDKKGLTNISNRNDTIVKSNEVMKHHLSRFLSYHMSTGSHWRFAIFGWGSNG